MKQSHLFTRTKKEAPKDEQAKNAELLIRAGYIHKEMAGVYAYLPLGLRVLEKIKNIIRSEMNALGGQELIMTSLQRKELWQVTDRWDDKKVDVWFKSQLKNGTEVGFGWSHEEQITNMMKSYVASYRDLPLSVYQFQTKLRNELRAKSGILRGREFLMKDLYSYSPNALEHEKFYEAVTQAYLRIFELVGLGEATFFTFASGGAFTQFSHEFQTLSAAGEDTIYLHRDKRIAINQEVMTEEVLGQLKVRREELEEVKAAEVGNIFNFGTTKSAELGLFYTTEEGKKEPVHLGSYGIGITRLMGVIVEHFADERGIAWPEAVAPYRVHLLSLGAEQEAEKIYADLTKAGVEVLYDDRDLSAGAKFAESDLLGLPHRLVISPRSLENGGAELKKRTEKEGQMLGLEEIVNHFQK